MVLPRASGLSGAFGRTIFRRAGAQARTRASRQIGRRTYASDHGHGGQQSSELPWIIGSVVVTVPAAGWLWSQGPTKGGHGHDSHGDSHEEKSEEGGEEPAEEEAPASEEESKEEEPKEEEPKQEESKDEEPKEEESKEESSDEKPAEEESGEGSDDKKVSKDEEKEGDQPGPNAPGQINWTSDSNKGPGEGQKGERKPSETQAEKNKSSHYSGAAHPYLDDPEKSKKGAGPTETAKIHGTVDTRSTPTR